MSTENYPPGAIYFSVVIDGEETAFEQISGLPTSFAVEVTDDGQNHHEYKLPAVTQLSNLVLTRGITSPQSKFAQWCAATLNSSISSPINTKDITVSLSPKLGIDMTRIFYKAYPIKWSTSLLQQDDMLVIDEVEFAYSYFHNISAIKITAYADKTCSQLLGGSEILFDPSSFKIDQDKQLTFELIFKRNVNEGLAKFKKVVYNYNGDIHQPNFLKIEWNGHVFKGRLASLDVNYTSFKHDGSPLSAVAKVAVID